jgi:hypothetical protein
MAKKVIKFQDSLGEYLKGCESTKVTLVDIIVSIELDSIENIINTQIVTDVNGLEEIELWLGEID